MSREKISGLISKVLPSHKVPQGRLRVLTPLKLRGQQFSFFYTDVNLPKDDLQYLEPGMMMEFIIGVKDDISPLSPRAFAVKPMDVAEYQGSVVRGPQPRISGHGFVVSLDLTKTHVKVSVESYNQLKLEQPPLPGDFCTVRILWGEMLLAVKENRIPLADIVTFIRRPPRVSVGNGSDHNEDSSHGLSPEETESDLTTDSEGKLSTALEALLAKAQRQRRPYSERNSRQFSRPTGQFRKRSKSAGNSHNEQATRVMPNIYSPLPPTTNAFKPQFQHFVSPLTMFRIQEMYRLAGHNSVANAHPALMANTALGTTSVFSYKHPIIVSSCQTAQQNFFNTFNVHFAHGYIS